MKFPQSFPPPRKDIHEITLNIDLAPFILDMAHMAPPQQMQGQSLLPLLTQDNIPWRDRFIYEYQYTYGHTIPECYGIRHNDWKYVQYITGIGREEQFFNVRDDAREQNNLISGIDQQRLLELRKQISHYRKT